MYDDDLFDRILVRPARQSGYRKLCIVSGYADPVLVSTQLDEKLFDYKVHVQLLVGMFPEPAHWDARNKNWLRYKTRLHDFRTLVSGRFGFHGSTFQCRYVIERPQIHTKVYVWLDDTNVPVKAFVGSPNYTKAAFDEERQGEAITVDGYHDSCYDYFVNHWNSAVSCDAPDVEQRLYNLRNR